MFPASYRLHADFILGVQRLNPSEEGTQARQVPTWWHAQTTLRSVSLFVVHDVEVGCQHLSATGRNDTKPSQAHTPNPSCYFLWLVVAALRTLMVRPRVTMCFLGRVLAVMSPFLAFMFWPPQCRWPRTAKEQTAGRGNGRLRIGAVVCITWTSTSGLHRTPDSADKLCRTLAMFLAWTLPLAATHNPVVITKTYAWHLHGRARVYELVWDHCLAI